jgi:hypothetical protein
MMSAEKILQLAGSTGWQTAAKTAGMASLIVLSPQTVASSQY